MTSCDVLPDSFEDVTSQFKKQIRFDEYNNYRVDMEVMFMCCGCRVLVSHNGDQFQTVLHDMPVVASAINRPLFTKAMGFLLHSIKDTPKDMLGEDWVHVIGLHKERGKSDEEEGRVCKRLWCESYNLHADILKTNPILNIDNLPLLIHS